MAQRWTAQDYNLVADTLRRVYLISDRPGKDAIVLTAREFATTFAADNTRFERQKFFQAIFGVAAGALLAA